MKDGAMQGAGRVLRLVLLGLGLLGLWPASGWAAEPTVALAWFPTQSPTNPTVEFPFATTERLRANASPSTGATVVKVEYYAGTILIGTATSPTSYPLYLASTSIGPGVYSLTAKVTDSLGAEASSAAVTFTVNARPTVTLTSPGANQVFASSAPIMLSASAADSDGTIAKVDFYRGTTLIGTATTTPYTLGWTNAAIGIYSLTAIATDNRGAVTTSTAVPISVIANSAPTISLTSPVANQSVRAPATITLAANASDPDNNLAKVEFFQNGTLIATVLAPPYTAAWSSVGQGSYAITALATDATGAQATSAPVTLTVTSAQATLYFIQADHLGTPRLVTDESNNVVWRNLPTTEPFGNTPPEEDPNATGHRFEMPLAFPGQYRDKESNLNQNYFRDYDPATGRYDQFDPIGLRGGINGYTYVNGNPVSYTDPLGLDWIYRQSTANLYHQPSDALGGGPPQLISRGGPGQYAGQNAGLNNPENQNVAGRPNGNGGPPPQGTYLIGAQQLNTTNDGRDLRASMRLTPYPTNEMFKRSGFIIHGDNSDGDQSASEGCPIIPLNIRNRIGKSNDKVLKVVR